jgi:hypothetical protein
MSRCVTIKYFANNYRYVKYEVNREESTKKMMLLTDFTRLPTYIKISSGLWRRVVWCVVSGAVEKHLRLFAV